jgi:hypothetical protein
MIMEHHYLYPKVIELRTARPWSPRATRRLSQRELVAASLIRCPNASKSGKRQ